MITRLLVVASAILSWAALGLLAGWSPWPIALSSLALGAVVWWLTVEIVR